MQHDKNISTDIDLDTDLANLHFDLNTVKYEIDEIRKKYSGQKQALEKQLVVYKEMAELIPFLQSLDEFQAAAGKEGITVVDWIQRTLQEGVNEKTTLPVRPDVYTKFKNLAHTRGISLEVLCHTAKATIAFENLLKNFQI